ncbi:aminoglycoside/hydroxyurea antibiotic resistance kinase [Kribbella flavida DSM 17836]|uniref:Aminoglycoside/hydroxyurea antibiotic resistance kinase n=1 Tax=Kribbella flavida (strain DSM 17836 / JCM 10339 / NBRC 14399) TaxID=479435 RepID=D2PQM9_KRIFD|nr:aminoglycoside phosphotransferase family protein [Kribbella flavida]ADB29216.1 aminoglycoside/hydroxyurea antibiotic resistance kinase [Kribbella flavida DSM 17836]
MTDFVIPPALWHAHAEDEDALRWLKSLPETANSYLDRWQLTVDGPPLHGGASLVLPVRRSDGVPAMLKLQPLNEENAAEALGLRTWDSNDVVQVLRADDSTATLLLERLQPRSLSDVPDDVEATRILAELLARLSVVPAPAQVRTLAEVAGEMVADAPELIPELSDPAERALVRRCVARVTELLAEPGDRLLHWDLHYDNVLGSERAPWLVIDPKPLAGDPAFELLPALGNRWDDLIATGDLSGAIRYRFDLMVDVVDLDRDRAVGWTLGRILQNVLWDVEDGERRIDRHQLAIARALSPTLG